MVVVEEEEVMGDKSEDGCLFIVMRLTSIDTFHWPSMPTAGSSAILYL